MNVNIEKIEDAGNLEKERIVFKVTLPDQVGLYAVFKTKKTGENTISSRTEATYWFPDRQVNTDDYVVLYTKKGVNTEKKNDDGTTSHFFYWDISNPIWNNSEDSIVLFKMDGWQHKSVAI